jgi:RHS repeat-associated protein
LTKLIYDYDAIGNLGKLSDSVSGDHIYVYDYDDRLIAHGMLQAGASTVAPRFEWATKAKPAEMVKQLTASTPSAAWLEWWAYDAVGDMTFNSNIGSYIYPKPGTVPADAPIEAGSIKFTYFPSGALRKVTGPHEQTTLAYDADSQLIQVSTNSASTQLSYDWDGRRIERSGSAQQTVEFLDDGYECIRGVCDAAILVQGKRLAAVGRKVVEYYHLDDLGSVRVVSDGNGSKNSLLTYASFGMANGTTKVTQARFAGNEFDGATNLYYVGARYFDPRIGRFITPEKMLFHGDRSRRWNEYSYALNNPLSWRDANGYDAERTGWNRAAAGGLMIVAGGAGLALTPFTGGMSLVAAFEIVGGITAGMTISAGIATLTIGGIEAASGKRLGAEGQVEEALSMTSGPGALAGELFSSAAGWSSHDRAAARSLGESIQTGLEFSRISGSVLGSSGAFGSSTGQLGLEWREGTAGVVSVGSYLLGKALPTDSPSKGTNAKEPVGSHEGPNQDKPSLEPTSGQTSARDEFGDIHGTFYYDRNGNEVSGPEDHGKDPDIPDTSGGPE